MTTRPRIFCIPATRAPIVAVLRRGPSDWCLVGRWHLEPPRFEAGAWFRGTLYPQKCDLSPDGRWLAYSAMKHPADWEAGNIYEAISRLPWLHALAAWGAGTTYTRGIHFTDEAGTSSLGAPDVGDAAPCLARFGLAPNRAWQFAVERRRGWREAPDSEPRRPNDMWDEQRSARMLKAQPQGDAELRVEGSWGAFRDSPQMREGVRYTLVLDGHNRALDAQWADWDANGRLLVATFAGRLQIRVPEGDDVVPAFDADLAALTPDPQTPPAWAREW